MKQFVRENSLTLSVFVLFLVSLAGQILTGYLESNADRQQHGQPAVAVGAYLGSGHFIEAVFENWESEFLQMGLFVVLTSVFKQRGSAESKQLDGAADVDADPRDPAERTRPDAPWPVKQGGWVLRLYENSLTLALFALFFVSLGLHAGGGAQEYTREQQAHGAPGLSPLEYLTTARMWFESFQNWQSEFLSIVALVVLSIFLRPRGSPESKSVAAPHHQTGDS